MNEVGTRALPGSCQHRICITCWVDHKGAEFISNKHSHSLTHKLTQHCMLVQIVKAGCWFVGNDDLTGALHVLHLQLSPPPPSPLAPIKSRMETFWYLLTRSSREMAVKAEREIVKLHCCI